MILHTRFPESGERTRTTAVFDGGARLWLVTCDPSNMFLHGVFRAADLSAGGFDEGTIFTHIRTGQKRKVGADGMLRKIQIKKSRRNKKKRTFAKSAKHGIGSGGANAVL